MKLNKSVPMFWVVLAFGAGMVLGSLTGWHNKLMVWWQTRKNNG